MDEAMAAVFAAYDDLRVATTVLHALRPGGGAHTGVGTLHAPGHAPSQPYAAASRLPPVPPGAPLLGAEADRLAAALAAEHAFYAAHVAELARRGWTLVRREGVWTVLADGELLAVLVSDSGAAVVRPADGLRLHVDGMLVRWTPRADSGVPVDEIDATLLALYSDALGRRLFSRLCRTAVKVTARSAELPDGRQVALRDAAAEAVHPDSRALLLSALAV